MILNKLFVALPTALVVFLAAPATAGCKEITGKFALSWIMAVLNQTIIRLTMKKDKTTLISPHVSPFNKCSNTGSLLLARKKIDYLIIQCFKLLNGIQTSSLVERDWLSICVGVYYSIAKTWVFLQKSSSEKWNTLYQPTIGRFGKNQVCLPTPIFYFSDACK